MSMHAVLGKPSNPLIRYRNCLLMIDLVSTDYSNKYLASKYSIRRDQITTIAKNIENELFHLGLAHKTLENRRKLRLRLQENKDNWLLYLANEIAKVKELKDFDELKANYNFT